MVSLSFCNRVNDSLGDFLRCVPFFPIHCRGVSRTDMRKWNNGCNFVQNHQETFSSSKEKYPGKLSFNLSTFRVTISNLFKRTLIISERYLSKKGHEGWKNSFFVLKALLSLVDQIRKLSNPHFTLKRVVGLMQNIA